LTTKEKDESRRVRAEEMKYMKKNGTLLDRILNKYRLFKGI
jgi:hypothetical protein